MGQVTVQIYTHFDSSSGSFERIAEITGLDEDVFVQSDYLDESQVVDAISAAFGTPRDQVIELRRLELATSEFSTFRIWARKATSRSEIAKRIKAAL